MRIPFLSNRFEARAAPIPDRVKAFLLGEDLNISNKAGVVVNEETASNQKRTFADATVVFWKEPWECEQIMNKVTVACKNMI